MDGRYTEVRLSAVGFLERTYPKVERLVGFCHSIGWVSVQAIGLGLLDPEELVRLTIDRFESSSYAAPEYNSDTGFWGWEREALERFFPKQGRILVGAAGAGREMIALHRAGYSVEGFECARTLVDAGSQFLQKAGCPGALQWEAAGRVPKLEGPFDGAIMGWSGYMYIPSRIERVELLRAFQELLRPGAPLLLSFQTREHIERRMYWSARVATWIRKIRGAGPVAVGDRLENGFKHWFNRKEIASEIAAAGMQLKWYSNDGYGWAVALRNE